MQIIGPPLQLEYLLTSPESFEFVFLLVEWLKFESKVDQLKFAYVC